MGGDFAISDEPEADIKCGGLWINHTWELGVVAKTLACALAHLGLIPIGCRCSASPRWWCSHSRCSDNIHFKLNQPYLDSKVKLECQKHTEGYADVVASNVDVCYHCLPSTANGNTFISSVKRKKKEVPRSREDHCWGFLHNLSVTSLVATLIDKKTLYDNSNNGFVVQLQ
jgi:hypothetical protein